MELVLGGLCFKYLFGGGGNQILFFLFFFLVFMSFRLGQKKVYIKNNTKQIELKTQETECVCVRVKT